MARACDHLIEKRMIAATLSLLFFRNFLVRQLSGTELKSYSREKKREKHAASNDDLNILLWGAHNEPSTHAGSETKVTNKQKQYLLPTRPKAT